MAIIGTADYRSMQEKRYTNGTKELIAEIARRLERQNIPFSGRINGNYGTITVSGDENKRIVDAMAESLKTSFTRQPRTERRIIGNTDFRYIPQKVITAVDPAIADTLENTLKANTIPYSGVVVTNGDSRSVKITVSAENKPLLDRYADEAVRSIGVIAQLQERGYSFDTSKGISVSYNGETLHYDTVAAFMSAYQNIDNGFFHPADYRVIRSVNDDGQPVYTLAEYSKDTGAPKNNGNTEEFYSVSSVERFIEENRNRINILTTADELQSFREMDMELMREQLVSRNRELYSSIDSLSYVLRFNEDGTGTLVYTDLGDIVQLTFDENAVRMAYEFASEYTEDIFTDTQQQRARVSVWLDGLEEYVDVKTISDDSEEYEAYINYIKGAESSGNKLYLLDDDRSDGISLVDEIEGHYPEVTARKILDGYLSMNEQERTAFIAERENREWENTNSAEYLLYDTIRRDINSQNPSVDFETAMGMWENGIELKDVEGRVLTAEDGMPDILSSQIVHASAENKALYLNAVEFSREIEDINESIVRTSPDSDLLDFMAQYAPDRYTGSFVISEEALEDYIKGNTAVYADWKEEVRELSLPDELKERIESLNIPIDDAPAVEEQTATVDLAEALAQIEALRRERDQWEAQAKANAAAAEDYRRQLSEQRGEKSFEEQVDDVLAGKTNRYEDIKVCDTPKVLRDIGLDYLPMFYSQNHLRKAVAERNDAAHKHGLSVEQVKRMAELLADPAMVLDSITRDDTVIAVTDMLDDKNAPVIISIRPNGKGHYELEEVDSNFVTSMYGKDNFESFLNRTIEQDKVLYVSKEKSQELFRVLTLQLGKGVNSLDFTNLGSDIIIHQSRNIVKPFVENISDNEQISEPEQSVSAPEVSQSETASQNRVYDIVTSGRVSAFREKTYEMYHSIGGETPEEIEESVRSYVNGIFTDYDIEAELGEVVLVGSRSRGLEKPGSDIDVVVSVYSDMKEDALFNILNEEPFEISGVRVDINPITAAETGSLDDYLRNAEEYLDRSASVESRIELPYIGVIDFKTIDHLYIDYSESYYEGGIDENGHERKDNYSLTDKGMELTLNGSVIDVYYKGDMGDYIESHRAFDLTDPEAAESLKKLVNDAIYDSRGDYTVSYENRNGIHRMLLRIEDVVSVYFSRSERDTSISNGVWSVVPSEGSAEAKIYRNGSLVCDISLEKAENSSDYDTYVVRSYDPDTTVAYSTAAALGRAVNANVRVGDNHSALDLAKNYINDFTVSEYSSEAEFDDLTDVHIAYTTILDEEIPLQISADLESYKLKYYLNDKLYDTEEYQSLEEMNEDLNNLDFNELVYMVEREDEEKIRAFVPEFFEGEAQPKTTYTIYQLPDGEKYHGIRYQSYKTLEKEGTYLNEDDYEEVYTGEIGGAFEGNLTLEALYDRFNRGEKPDGYNGRSMSVGDVVVIEDREGKAHAHIVETAGFERYPQFFMDKDLISLYALPREERRDNVAEYIAGHLFAGDEYEDMAYDMFEHGRNVSADNELDRLILDYKSHNDFDAEKFGRAAIDYSRRGGNVDFNGDMTYHVVIENGKLRTGYGNEGRSIKVKPSDDVSGLVVDFGGDGNTGAMRYEAVGKALFDKLTHEMTDIIIRGWFEDKLQPDKYTINYEDETIEGLYYNDDNQSMIRIEFDFELLNEALKAADPYDYILANCEEYTISSEEDPVGFIHAAQNYDSLDTDIRGIGREVIESIGSAIDEHNSRVDSLSEAERTLGAVDRASAENDREIDAPEKPTIKVSELSEGDKFRLHGREYTIVSMDGGIYPDDVVISKIEDMAGASYSVTENFDRFRLIREGEYLGNPEKEAQKQAKGQEEEADKTETDSKGITIEGQDGTWSVINTMTYGGKELSLLENDELGDEVPYIIMDSDNKVLSDRAHSFEDFTSVYTESEVALGLVDKTISFTVAEFDDGTEIAVFDGRLNMDDIQKTNEYLDYADTTEFDDIRLHLEQYIIGAGLDPSNITDEQTDYIKSNLSAVKKDASMLESDSKTIQHAYLSAEQKAERATESDIPDNEHEFETTVAYEASAPETVTGEKLHKGDIVLNDKALWRVTDDVTMKHGMSLSMERISTGSGAVKQGVMGDPSTRSFVRVGREKTAMSFSAKAELQRELDSEHINDDGQVSLFSNTEIREAARAQKQKEDAEILRKFNRLATLGEGDTKESAIHEEVTVDEELNRSQEKHDFTITSDDFNTTHGQKNRFRQNVEAIRTLKQIEGENRLATPEEQQILSGYVGWGGIPEAFDSTKENWQEEYSELKELLTDDEYAAARASVTNAHYTSPIVIEAMYTALQNMGFEGGKVLDPSMGTGNFEGKMPEEMREKSRITGVELDSITGRMAKQLYQSADLQIKGFENTNFENNSFDVAISNVPFGNYKVFDKDYLKQNFAIHNYFFAKSLDKVHPGGIVAFVTSQYTMDSTDTKVREYLAQRAELLGAIRLPMGAFRDIAGTDVGTDIIFLQKRERPIKTNDTWIEKGQTEDGIPVNAYFAEHPEMVLGNLQIGKSMYGTDSVECVPIEGADLKEQLAGAIQNIQGEYRTAAKEHEESRKTEREAGKIPAPNDLKFNSYAVVNDKLYLYDSPDGMMREVTEKDLAKNLIPRAKDMVKLRDQTNTLLELERDNVGGIYDDAVELEMEKLNKLYDGFVAKHGRLTDKQNIKAFERDSSLLLVRGLEKTDSNGEFAGKADVFTKQTIRGAVVADHVDCAYDAYVLSMNEKMHVDFDYMTKISGLSKDQLIADLGDKLYQDPAQNMEWVSADEYLTGNVRQKLREAQGAGLERNISALEKVQPEWIEAVNIDAKLGAPWIDEKYIKEFASDLLGVNYFDRQKLKVEYEPVTGEWKVERPSNLNFNAAEIYGLPKNSRYNAYALLQLTLNNQTATVKVDVLDEYGQPRFDDKGNKLRVIDKEQTDLARVKQDNLREAFAKWVFDDPERRRALTEKYNNTYNAVRLREFDGSNFNFVGMNSAVNLMPHQKNAILRSLSGGNTLLAHEVGAGKSFEMSAIAMEGKRLGLHNKALIVVPNHLTTQMGKEFSTLYPSARLLVATEKDFRKENRDALYAKIAFGDYDAIVMGHSQFDRVHLNSTTEERWLRKQIDNLRTYLNGMRAKGDGDRLSVKKIEGQVKTLEEKLKKLLDKSQNIKDDFIEFEKLGIDKLFIDESQAYKNRSVATKLSNVAGLGGQGAMRSELLAMKIAYLNEKGGTVTFASGTPISNSITEMYTVMDYLEPDKLKKMNINNFDDWVRIFATPKTEMELKPTGNGQYQDKTRLKFSNLPELMTAFKEVADIKTAETLNLERPDAVEKTIVAEPSREQLKYIRDLGRRAEKIHKEGRKIDPKVDNMLKITSEGRKCGLDMRLLDPNAKDDPNSKVNLCIDNVFRIWEDTSERNGTQLIFCDMSTPKEPPNENIYTVYRKGESSYQAMYSENTKQSVTVDAIYEKLTQKPSEEFFTETSGLQEGDIIVKRNVFPDEKKAYNTALIVENGQTRELAPEEWEQLHLSPVEDYEHQKAFCVYDDIKEKLIARGVPEEQIAFIHDAANPQEAQQLYEKMNKGEIRVMIGSSAKCGAGMNAQNKMVALHHLDAPFRPSDIGQRNGRIQRRGNENKEVEIYKYVTNRTFDAYIYQLLENKQKFISAVMTEKSPVRTCDDVDEVVLSFAETKACCAGNPDILRQVQLDREIKGLQTRLAEYQSSKYRMQDSIVNIPGRIQSEQRVIEKINADIELAKNTPMEVYHRNEKTGREDKEYPLTIKGVKYSDRQSGAEALKTFIDRNITAIQSGYTVDIGEYRGFKLAMYADPLDNLMDTRQPKFILKGNSEHYCNISFDDRTAMNYAQLNRCIENMDREKEYHTERIAELKSELDGIQKKIDIPFEHQQELDTLQAELKEVNERLRRSADASDINSGFIYEWLVEMCPEIQSGKDIYVKYEPSDPDSRWNEESGGLEPLIIETDGNKLMLAQTYKENGDLMYDPMITMELNHESKTVKLLSYENSGLGKYEKFVSEVEGIDENGNTVMNIKENKQGMESCGDFICDSMMPNIQAFDYIRITPEPKGSLAAPEQVKRKAI